MSQRPSPLVTVRRLWSERPELSLAVVLFVLAVVVRWPGIAQGLPYAAHPDEAQLLHRGLYMLKTGDLNPHYFNYPSFPMYVHAAVAATGVLQLITDGTIKSLGEIQTMMETGLKGQRVPVLLMERARIVSVLFGALGVAGVGVFARRLFGQRIGLMAGIATVFTVIHISSVRYITTDALAACFVPWAAAVGAQILRRDRLGDYAFAGALVGLSAASKYNAAAILLVPILAHALRDEHPRGHVGPLFLLLFTTAVTFFGVNPYALMDVPEFLTGVGAELRHYAVGDAFGPANAEPGLPHLLRILTFAASVNGLALWAPLALLAPRAWKQHERRVWTVFLAYPVVATWLLARQSVFFPRNLVLVLPTVGTLAALAADALWDRVRAWPEARRRIGEPVVGLVLVLPALFALGWVATEAAPPESRNDALAYARTALPAGSVVAVPREMDLEIRAWRNDSEAPSKVVETTLASMTLAKLAEQGATHVILSERFGYAGGYPGITERKVEFLNQAVALLPQVQAFGAGPYALGQNIFSPRVAILELGDPAVRAAADVFLEKPALDPEGGFFVNNGFEDEVVGADAPGWKVVTLDAQAAVEKQGTGHVFRIDATPIANTTILCMNGEVAVEGPVVLRGRWKASKLKPGLRAQVRYFTDAPVAQIREVAWLTDGDWTDFSGVAEVPKGTTRAKACFLVQGESGNAWLDDLYFGPATEADIARAAGGAVAAAAGPQLPEPWIAVPSSLPAEGRAGPLEGVEGGFFVSGPLVGEAMACDNTPREAGKGGKVTLKASLDAGGVVPGISPALLPRLQVRGMAQAGGAALIVHDTIVVAADGKDLSLNGEVTLPAEAPFYKLCVVVRTRDTRVDVRRIESVGG
jgi:hypothetical protein